MAETKNIEDLFGEDGGGQQPAPVTLEQIKEVGNQAVALSAEVEALDKALGEKKKELNELLQNKLPLMMVGVPSITLDNGMKITIGNFVSGSLPKEPAEKQAAIEWLEANEGGGIIKTEVSVSFAKSLYDEAKKLAEELKEEGFAVDLETGVHSQTLAAFVRERMQNGDPVDHKVLGVYVGRHAKLEKVKVKNA